MYHPTLPNFWFLQNRRYALYMLRELTGVIIAAYFLYSLFIIGGPNRLFTQITLAASVFHTLTWLWVSIKISLTETQNFITRFLKIPQILLALAAYILLISLWFVISLLLLNYFYTP